MNAWKMGVDVVKVIHSLLNYAMQYFTQFFDSIWFGNNTTKTIFPELSHHWVIGITA